MNDDQVGGAIRELERALVVEDPAFVHRMRRLERGEAINAVVTTVVLVIGAVLLTVGFALAAFVPWLVGAASLLGAVLIDGHHRRTLRQRR